MSQRDLFALGGQPDCLGAAGGERAGEDSGGFCSVLSSAMWRGVRPADHRLKG
jgi:hypothetical protein